MAWELKKVEDQRAELVKLYAQGILSMTDICKQFGVSRKTGYKWIRRYEENGIDGLIDESRSPKAPYRIYPESQIAKALEVKCRYSTWGPRKVLAWLSRKYPDVEWPSETRLYEIFKEHGLVKKRRLRRRVPATHPLGYVTGANDVWSLDFKGWFLVGNGEKCEPFTVTDGHTRFVIRCLHMKKKTSGLVWEVLTKAFHEYGLPARIRTDNGPPFGSVGAGRLTTLSVNLIKAGVLPEWIEPGHPEENGRHERFHLTLKQAVAEPPAASLTAQAKANENFVYEYNFERPHEALGMTPPGEHYHCSNRAWTGRLISPEYESKNGKVRKVTPGGSIWVSGNEIYVSQALTGEHVQIVEAETTGDDVYYGPILLGKLIPGQGLVKPKRN